MGSREISNRKLIKGMAKIGLEDRCILMIRKGSELAGATTIEQISSAVKQMGIRDVGILIVDSFADIGKLPEHKLNNLGYYKMSDASQKLLEYMEKEKENGEET